MASRDGSSPGEEGVEVIVVALGGEEVASFRLATGATVAEVKRRLSALRGFPFFTQQLARHADVLDDELSLHELGPTARLSLIRLPLDRKGGSLLHAPVANGRVAYVEELLRRFADPNTPGGGDKLPIHVAAQWGQPEAARLLLTAAAHVNAVHRDFGTSALHFAGVGLGHAEVARVLCESRAEVNALDGVGATPLIAAARTGNAGVVRILCEARASVDAADEEGCTALHLAERLGHRTVREVLFSVTAAASRATGLL